MLLSRHRNDGGLLLEIKKAHRSEPLKCYCRSDSGQFQPLAQRPKRCSASVDAGINLEIKKAARRQLLILSLIIPVTFNIQFPISGLVILSVIEYSGKKVAGALKEN